MQADLFGTACINLTLVRSACMSGFVLFEEAFFFLKMLS